MAEVDAELDARARAEWNDPKWAEAYSEAQDEAIAELRAILGMSDEDAPANRRSTCEECHHPITWYPRVGWVHWSAWYACDATFRTHATPAPADGHQNRR